MPNTYASLYFCLRKKKRKKNDLQIFSIFLQTLNNCFWKVQIDIRQGSVIADILGRGYIFFVGADFFDRVLPSSVRPLIYCILSSFVFFFWNYESFFFKIIFLFSFSRLFISKFLLVSLFYYCLFYWSLISLLLFFVPFASFCIYSSILLLEILSHLFFTLFSFFSFYFQFSSYQPKSVFHCFFLLFRYLYWVGV